ncbi:hypothetical protein L9F63_010541 [Diploptera punctata]|uniref:Chaoptin n=1 Tax=Diploptera punctata TaxID=6984 RepID=A0AAD8ERC6_DIPPU|nr:hypothetical protein L9F63_010541 [Diploptera punctata]
MASSVSNIPAEALRTLVTLQHLDFSNNKIRSMPETSFHFLKRLKVLELQDNQIDLVHKGTFQGGIHGSLEELYLSYNNLQVINTHTFVDLSSLTWLQLDDNKISRIEKRAFMNMDRLKRLDLRGNKIHSISDEAFQNLPELELLDIAYNQLQDLDFAMLDQVGTLSSFKLNVSHNSLQKLEQNSTIGRGSEVSVLHSNIKVLDLSNNNVSRIGRTFFRPVERSLTHLHMSHNWLSNATREVFGNMPHLQWLDLSYNQLAEMDFDTFRNTRNLQVLLLAHNWLSDIPAELFRFNTDLRFLDMSHNRLRALPDNFLSDDGMEHLDVSHNLLSRPPVTSLGPAAAATLCELDLSYNSIAALQSIDLLSRFKSLTWLDLSHNRLVRIEDSTFSSLNHLSFLDLSHNKELVLETRGRSFKGLEDSLLHLRLNNDSLNEIPDLPLRSLRTLQVSHNQIDDIPNEMPTNLTSLRNLDVSYNHLQAVPPAARSMSQLKSLQLEANQITTISSVSFQGAMEQLEELDIRHMPLNYFEPSALSKMTSLRTLKISSYREVKEFNIPEIVKMNYGLRDLHLEVFENTPLEEELSGQLPTKVRNITVSGRGISNIPDNLFKGVRSPRLHFALRNTSVEKIPQTLFQQGEWIRNLSLDLRNNSLLTMGNPNTAEFPGSPKSMFLTELQLQGNKWTCDCQIGWVEVWLRKKRQYMCPAESRTRESICHEISAEQDDLREAKCDNRNNASFLEILKSEVECGWGSGAPTLASSWFLVVIVFVATFLRSDL